MSFAARFANDQRLALGHPQAAIIDLALSCRSKTFFSAAPCLNACMKHSALALEVLQIPVSVVTCQGAEWSVLCRSQLGTDALLFCLLQLSFLFVTKC